MQYDRARKMVMIAVLRINANVQVPYYNDDTINHIEYFCGFFKHWLAVFAMQFFVESCDLVTVCL